MSFLISELNSLRVKFDELTSQLTKVGNKSTVLQATVTELEQSIARIQCELKTSHINNTTFLNRKLTWKIPAVSLRIKEVLSSKTPIMFSHHSTLATRCALVFI